MTRRARESKIYVTNKRRTFIIIPVRGTKKREHIFIVADVNQSGTIDRKDFELAIEVCGNLCHNS